jgi:hypothetical protein
VLGGLSPIAKVRRSASTAFVSHWCAPRIYVNCTNHSGFSGSLCNSVRKDHWKSHSVSPDILADTHSSVLRSFHAAADACGGYGTNTNFKRIARAEVGCRLAVRPARTANNRTYTAADPAKPEQASDHHNAAYHRNAAWTGARAGTTLLRPAL